MRASGDLWQEASQALRSIALSAQMIANCIRLGIAAHTHMMLRSSEAPAEAVEVQAKLAADLVRAEARK